MGVSRHQRASSKRVVEGWCAKDSRCCVRVAVCAAQPIDRSGTHARPPVADPHEATRNLNNSTFTVASNSPLPEAGAMAVLACREKAMPGRPCIFFQCWSRPQRTCASGKGEAAFGPAPSPRASNSPMRLARVAAQLSKVSADWSIAALYNAAVCWAASAWLPSLQLGDARACVRPGLRRLASTSRVAACASSSVSRVTPLPPLLPPLN